MPLSEHEQQMLAQLEQALASEDPRFAHQMRDGSVGGRRRRRLIVGLVGLVLGLGLIVVGINTTWWVGVAGFAVMVAAVAHALAPVPTLDTTTSSASVAKGSARPGFMHKLDERWERRERGM